MLFSSEEKTTFGAQKNKWTLLGNKVLGFSIVLLFGLTAAIHDSKALCGWSLLRQIMLHCIFQFTDEALTAIATLPANVYLDDAHNHIFNIICIGSWLNPSSSQELISKNQQRAGRKNYPNFVNPTAYSQKHLLNHQPFSAPLIFGAIKWIKNQRRILKTTRNKTKPSPQRRWQMISQWAKTSRPWSKGKIVVRHCIRLSITVLQYVGVNKQRRFGGENTVSGPSLRKHFKLAWKHSKFTGAAALTTRHTHTCAFEIWWSRFIVKAVLTL